MTLSAALARSSFPPFLRVKEIFPEAMVPPPCSMRRITDNDVTDFPEPDSPTMAKTSPART